MPRPADPPKEDTSGDLRLMYSEQNLLEEFECSGIGL